MTKEQLVKAAEELQTVLNLTPPIDLQQTKEDLSATLKEAALWLQLPDPISEDTLEVLRALEWFEADFENLEEDQDPLPFFEQHKINVPGMEEVEEEPEPEPKPKRKPIPKAKAEPEPKEEEPEPAPEPKPKAKKGPAAYGTALEIMASDPEMTLHTLYDEMEARGFDTRSHINSAKTARAVFKKIYNQLKENGFINVPEETEA